MLRYAITSGAQYNGPGVDKAGAIIQDAGRWAAEGIDFIQVREKEMEAGALAELTRRVVAAVRASGEASKVLVNSRADVAIAAGADGVHLTSAEGGLRPDQVRDVWRLAGAEGGALVSVSCHSVAEVERAAGWGVDAILFGPVFGKTVDGVEVMAGVGVELLREACVAAGGVPVLALGGVTGERVAECAVAGAAGVAGIRLFGTD